MKNYVIILIGVIIAIIIVGGTVMYSSMNNDDNSNNVQVDVADNNTDNVTVDISANNVSDSSDDSSEPYIVSEEIKYNGQQGGGYYREVTYSDGNFRQYDLETGKLIGSSFSSDQSKLPSME